MSPKATDSRVSQTRPEPVPDGPCRLPVRRGHYYFWCSCGRSAQLPFCDASHRGSTALPLVWQAAEDGEVLWCNCRRSQQAPLCDHSCQATYDIPTAPHDISTADNSP